MQNNVAASYPLDMEVRSDVARLLFWAAAVFGASIYWLAPHPPMADLAQHGGQIVLMRDLLFGDGRWADVVRLNWFTPYLIGYLLALPLSLALPIAMALKVLLSLAYLAFVAMCVILRRHFGGDPRLDWFALIPFFGLSYKWGFLTFFVAAPIALALVLLSSRYVDRPTIGRGAAVFGVGLVLLASHGLQFAFGWSVATALLAFRWRNARFSLAVFVPHLILAVVCGLYFVISRNVEADFNVPYEYYKKTDYDLKRLLKIPLFTVGAREDVVLLPLVVVLLAVPWLYGLRPSRERAIACVPFAVVAGIMLLVPSFAMNTAFLYERFELFFLPTYGWMFAATGRQPAPSPRTVRCTTLAMIAICSALLTLNAVRAWSFGREASGVDALIGRLEPFQRALILVYEGDSPASNNPFIYISYPAWYQAERGGMVDFNFAWFPPQIVRFRPGHLPPWRPGYEWRPDRFDWNTHRGSDYRYFFVRSPRPLPPTLFQGAECAPMPIWSGNQWTVFERRPCR